MQTFQQRVTNWVVNVFGVTTMLNKQERAERFIEEAIELVQACALPKERVEALLEHVYSRPKGRIAQEVGGVMVTLAALSQVHGRSMDVCGNIEIARIEQPELWPMLKEKHFAKPRQQALP